MILRRTAAVVRCRTKLVEFGGSRVARSLSALGRGPFRLDSRRTRTHELRGLDDR